MTARSWAGTTVLVCFGTRPEAIKLAPVVERLRAEPGVRVVTATTAQHRQLVDQVLDVFGLQTDFDLDLMRTNQSLAELTSRAVLTLAGVIEQATPDAVIVQGDTTTAMCGALAAFYAEVPVGHVEAGLRTGDLSAPFPEEANRRLISMLARWHWAPAASHAEALAAEGIRTGVTVTGNTVVDALHMVAARPLTVEQRELIGPRTRAKRLLVTLHRRETQGEAQARLFDMLARVAARGDVEVVFPVHRSPRVREPAREHLADVAGVRLLDALDYATFVQLMRASDLILTDSGGIQEEAPALGIPTLVARERTERTDAVEAGCLRVCGVHPETIERELTRLLDDPDAYAAMAHVAAPYGDGHAADRIVEVLLSDLGAEPARVA